jgi:dynein heavy chain, axonemal
MHMHCSSRSVTNNGALQVHLYEDLGSYERVKDVMERILESYNEKHKRMNLVFFEDCLQHVVRVMRTITLARGNNLLVGVGGSGKKSITQLAAYAAQCGVFEITLSRGYDEVAFRDDLKVRLLFRASSTGTEIDFGST